MELTFTRKSIKGGRIGGYYSNQARVVTLEQCGERQWNLELLAGGVLGLHMGGGGKAVGKPIEF